MVTRDTGNVIGAARTTKVGVGLAAAIIGGWLAIHILSVFFLEISTQTFALMPAIIALQSWLSVGLFITAHDAIHGTLAPANKRLNGTVGRIATTLYGGFDFDKLARDHHRHHRHSGTDADPDFSAAHPRNPILWALAFFWQHLTWRVLLFFPLVFSFEVHILGADRLNLFLFFSLPAILSALQLFIFGTFLPHRHSDGARFADEHRARSSDFGPLASLLSCYHFGYHHEHHLHPHLPWWRLPEMRWRHADPA